LPLALRYGADCAAASVLTSFRVQAPKEQKSKEAKALAAANSSKGKKKVRLLPSCAAASLGHHGGTTTLTPVTSRWLSLACCVQKWSKGKMKEKANNMVLFDKVRRW
jgi:small subunit ribosomal protein S25e